MLQSLFALTLKVMSRLLSHLLQSKTISEEVLIEVNRIYKKYNRNTAVVLISEEEE